MSPVRQSSVIRAEFGILNLGFLGLGLGFGFGFEFGIRDFGSGTGLRLGLR